MSFPGSNVQLTGGVLPHPEALGSFPLTSAQEELWFLEQVSPGNVAYNLAEAWELQGSLDVAALRQALEGLVKRHEALRTLIQTVSGKPVQVVMAPKPVDLPVTELTIPAQQSVRESAVLLRLAEEARRPFNLAQAPLFRATLYRLGPDRHVLSANLHHIVCDAASQNVFIQDLAELYRAATDRVEAHLPELEIQFADYAVWRRDVLDPNELERQLAHWRQRLDGMPSELPIPTDFARPNVCSYTGVTQFRTIEAGLVQQLKQLSRERGVSLYMTLLSAFYVLLHRLTREHDLVIGSPVSGRDRLETERLIGMFVNTLPCRTSLAGNPSFTELLRRVRQSVLETHGNLDVSLDRLVRELRPDRRLGRNPLFQVVFGLQPAPTERLIFGNLAAERVEFDNGSAKFDWTLLATESSEGLSLRSEFSADLFKPATASAYLEGFTTLLSSIASGPGKPISRLRLITDRQRQELLDLGADTAAPYERDLCIHQLFEIQALSRPGAVALRINGAEMTYAELDKRANALAADLKARGVGPDVLVGVCLERSFELIIAFLAVLKAGGAYVPLDKAYPRSRLEFILRDTNAPLLISTNADAEVFAWFQGQVLMMGAPARDIAQPASAEAPATVPSQATDLAYVLYTSGSTGQPKGVAVPHRAVVRLVRKNDFVDVRREDVFLQFASVCFDASTFEIWGALLNGAQLTIFPPHFPSLGELGRAVADEKITTLWLTSGLFNQMVDTQVESLRGVRNLLAGGEALSVPHVLRAKANLPGCSLINGYGPTESTTFATTYCVPAAADLCGPAPKSIPIGKPIKNTAVFVLDEHNEPCPRGFPGELLIAGDGLARGYINNSQLTAEKFPIQAGSLRGPLYRTGDLVRWLPDGNLEFLGRLDQQVKIRGFRVEPEEIEVALKHSPDVRDAAVVAGKDPAGTSHLRAYVVLRPDRSCSGRDLQRYLQPLLPSWMIPSSIQILDELPLTTNGKIDRKRLHDLRSEPAEPGGYTLPRTSEEQKILSIWQDVLGRNSFGVDDNFFHLGGHSLLATQAISRLSEAFAVELPIRLIFEHPTVATLASAITQMRELLPSRSTLGSRREKRQRAAALLQRVEDLTPEQVEELLRDPNFNLVK